MSQPDMIERVARAIALVNGPAVWPLHDGTTVEFWRECIPEARAAIEAMRDLTPDMLSVFMAGIEQWLDEVGESEDIWRATIDAALSEAKG